MEKTTQAKNHSRNVTHVKQDEKHNKLSKSNSYFKEDLKLIIPKAIRSINVFFARLVKPSKKTSRHRSGNSASKHSGPQTRQSPGSNRKTSVTDERRPGKESFMAEIQRMKVEDLEEIARQEGLNHLIGMQKKELIDQLADYYLAASAKLGGKSGIDELSKEDLYKKAQELHIAGRSRMSKEELKDAVQSAS